MYVLINDFTPTRSDEEQAKRYRVGIHPRLGPRGGGNTNTNTDHVRYTISIGIGSMVRIGLRGKNLSWKTLSNLPLSKKP
jgi:hypothetical protein